MEAIKTIIDQNNLTPKPSETAMRQSSQALTPAKPSELNAGEILGDIFDRFYQQAGWNVLTDEERDLRIATGLEVLGAADVPPKYYDELYRRAMATRAKRKSEGETVFTLSAEDLAVEWHGLKNELATGTKPDLSPATCPNRAWHIGGEPVCEYGPPGAATKLPCHVCRPTAFSQRSAETIYVENPVKRLRGEVQKQPETAVELVVRIIAILNRETIASLGTPEHKQIRSAWLFWKRVLIRVGQKSETPGC